MRKGSGKQILLKILYELSTKLIDKEELPAATDRIRAGLLLHGSTSETNFDLVSKLHWSSSEKDGEVVRQGLAALNGNVFVSDILESIWCNDKVKSLILDEYPSLTEGDYEACLFSIWAMTSSSQMFSYLRSVETQDDINIDDWVRVVINAYNKHHDAHED
ncbi:hypothetical protein [Hahella chejuensis]|uniref:hypothetical protein n=1 Tax=Hahella chejuensis TaxID=158327 RepID=UPI0005A01315|nr:hypothetical protein [Hahella chejuensis]